MEGVVFFVYAAFEKTEEMGMGVWHGRVKDICSQFKTGGQRSGHLQKCYGHVVSLRMVETLKGEYEGEADEIISESTYSQRDMRCLSR